MTTAPRPVEVIPPGLPGLQAADFVRLFDITHSKMVALAGRIVGPEAAEDVAQQAWLQAWQRRTTFRGDAAPSSWLYRITVNLAISCYRTQRRRPLTEALDDETPVPCPAADAEALALQAERRRLLAAAFRQLPLHERMAIGLVDLDERTSTEVAALIHVKPNTVKTRVYRGRQRLRRLLTEGAAA